MTLISLLSSLADLTVPDREIDAEIALAMDWTRRLSDTALYWNWIDPRGNAVPVLPKFTKSLDVVLALLPPHWIIHIIHGGILKADGTQSWTVELVHSKYLRCRAHGAHDSLLTVALLIAIIQATMVPVPSQETEKTQ